MRGKRPPLWLALAFAGALLLCAVPFFEESESQEAAVARIVDRLPTLEDDEAAGELRALGEGAVLPIYRALSTGRTWDADGEGEALGERGRTLLRAVLASYDGRVLAAFFAREVRADAAVQARVEALLALGGAGTPRELPALPDLCGTEAGPAILDAFETAVLVILARAPEAYPALEEVWHRAAPELRPALISAVARSADPLGLAFVTDRIGSGDALDRMLLDAVTRMGPRASLDQRRDAAVAVRSLLDAQDGAVVQAAAIALARIGDHDDVLPLIERLETETSGSVIDRLDGTLARITGAACRRDPVRWRAWYEREAGWFERDAEPLLQDLGDPRDEIVFAALHELRKHPLYRAELAPDVAVVLDHDSPALRLTAAQALGELGHEPSIEELIPSLDDADSSVATAACAALRKISGLDLLCDRESWIRALRAPGS